MKEEIEELKRMNNDLCSAILTSKKNDKKKWLYLLNNPL